MSFYVNLPEDIKKWIMIFIITFIGTALFYNPESMPITLFWFITFLGISTLAFEPIPNFVTGIFLMLFYIVFEVAPANVVFSPWLNVVPWQIAGGLCISRTVQKTGFAQRIALILIRTIGKTPFLLFLSFLATGYVLNLIIPSGVTNTIILSTFAVGICQALNFEPGSKGATSIMLATYFGAMTSAITYLPSSLAIVGVTLLEETTDFTVSPVDYTLENFSLILVSSLAAMFLVYLFSRKEISQNISKAREHATQELQKRGKIARDEIVAICLFTFAVIAYFTQGIHGLPGIYLMVVIIFFAFLPPFRLLDNDDIQKLSIPALFFMVGCMSIGIVAAHLGLPAWVSAKLVPMLSAIETQSGANLFAYMVAVFANLVLTPLAAAASLTIPMTELATQMGFSVKPLIYSFFLGLDQWFFPYETVPAIFLFATGYLRMKYVVILTIVRAFLVAGVIWLNSVTVWNFMGL